MKQKSQSSLIAHDSSFKHLFFSMIYKINANRSFKKETNIGSYLISIVINLIIFLGCKDIAVISNVMSQFGVTVHIALFGIFGFTILQYMICLFYQLKFYLAVQFKITRFIIFPVGINFLLKQSLNQEKFYFIYLALGFFIIVYVLNVLFESQSFTDYYIHNKSLPITSYFVIVEVIFYGIDIVQQQNLVILFSCIMVIVSFIIKSSFFVNQIIDHVERKLLSVACFMYCSYSLIIFISTLSGNSNIKIVLCFVVPIVVYYATAQMVKQKAIPLTFKRIFSSDSLNFEEFVVYAQYLIEQANQFNQAVHSNFCQSLTFTFYSDHQKYCDRAGCKFLSQNWKDEFRNTSDPKTIKKLTQKVIRKLQTLFDQVHKNEPENIQLKLAFIKFYIHTLPNKIRVLQLISQVQNMNRTMINDYQIFRMKLLSDQMDSIEVIDNLKTDDEVNQFQRIAYLTINSMMEFWMHFSQEKIDLVKVMNTSQRLLNYKKQMQTEWQKNKYQEKYSTLKIALLYSYYLKYVAHDQQQASLLEYSAKALEEKLLHKKEIKYLSFGSEAALIGASLTDQNLGKIVIANNQASNVFNYSKQQINRIRLNQIMPKIFADQHDHYLMEFHKNKYKRINSDQRPLFGKDKYGFIIPILLQLQRTISSLSQELLFVANIRKFKVRETPLICITDQEGEITDVSSGFKEVFYEKKEQGREKIEIPTRNIQEIIATFFQKSQPQDCGHFKFVQKFQKQKYGQMIIQFTVIPISFPLKPNGGFIVMGNRQTSHTGLALNHLNLTKQIDSRINKQLLYGNKAAYNPQKNRYQISAHKTKFSRGKDLKQQIYTIPFINIHDMANVFSMGKDDENYGDKIRTVRLTDGGALVRVETNDTFQSQDMSQNEKVNRFQFKLKQLKYQYLHNKKNLMFISFGRIFIALIVLTLILIFITQINFLQSQTTTRINLLRQLKYRFEIRGYISQYILSFNGLSANYDNAYFINKTHSVRDKLVNVIEGASIQQTKKQPMFKTIYLQNQSDLKELITSETLTFSTVQLANVTEISNLWIVFMVVLSVFLIFQIIMKCIHSNKIYGVYHVFLGVDQRLVKKSYDSCLKFSQMLQQKQGQQKRQLKPLSDQNDQDNQNPVSRMKKYKEDSSVSLVTYVKYYLSFLVIIFVCIIIYVLIDVDVQSFNRQIQIFNRVEGLFPQSSIALMNSYYKSYKKSPISITQSFNSTYQRMDSAIFQYQKETSSTLQQSFFSTLLNNACQTTLTSLSQQYSTLCTTFQQSIFTTGIDKVTNHLAQQIQHLNQNLKNSSIMDREFFQLFQLQYDFYVPMVANVSNLIHQEMINDVGNFQEKYKIWMGVVTLIVVINSFYIYHILLNQMKNQIQLVKELLYFIPDNLIEDKNKLKKKLVYRNTRTLKNAEE